MTIAPAPPAATERSGAGAWFWPLLFLAAYALVLAWLQQHAFAGLVPIGDHAADDILIVDAKRFTLLHGVYSRFDFYHPGPLILQITALGELILFDWLRWFSSYFLAQAFVTSLLHGIALAFVLRLWLVVTGRGLIAVLAVAIVIATISHAGGPVIFVRYWLAHSTVASATMLATALAGLLLRGPAWLPLLAAGAVILINGHVSFVSIVPVLLIAVALVAIYVRRLPFPLLDGRAILRYAALHWLAIALSTAITLIGLMPIAINVIVNWPAELPRYLEVARTTRGIGPLGLIVFMASFVPLYGVWMLVFVRRLRPATEDRRQADIRIAGVTIFWTALVVAFLLSLKGVDSRHHRFLLFWLTPFIGMAASAAFVYAWSVWPQRSVRAAIAVGVVALVVWPIAEIGYRWEFPDTRRIGEAANILSERAVPGRRTVLVLDHKSPHWKAMWSQTVGVVAILNRRNDRSVCIERRSWHLLFHARYRCPENISPDDVVLHVVPAADASGTVVAPLLDVVIVQPEKAAR